MIPAPGRKVLGVAKVGLVSGFMITHVAGSWGSCTRPRMSDSAELERGEGACLLHWLWESRDWVTLSSGVKWRKFGMAAVETTGELTTPGGGLETRGGGVTENSEDRKSCSTLELTSGSCLRPSFELPWPGGCSLSRG